MVSLDDAVIARFEKGGNRYEILVDPELVAQWKGDNDSVVFEDMLATDEVWSDVKAGDRPCLLYTSPSPRDQRGSRMPSSA